MGISSGQKADGAQQVFWFAPAESRTYVCIELPKVTNRETDGASVGKQLGPLLVSWKSQLGR